MAVNAPLNITEMNSGIENTLATATGLTYTQDYDKLTEGIIDTPLLQVYWQGHVVDPNSGASQQSFRGGARHTSLTFHADLYPKQRADIAEDFGVLLPLVDAIDDVLIAQRVKPYFGVAKIQAIENWTASQVTFEYPNNIKFLGARFIIRVRVF